MFASQLDSKELAASSGAGPVTHVRKAAFKGENLDFGIKQLPTFLAMGLVEM